MAAAARNPLRKDLLKMSRKKASDPEIHVYDAAKQKGTLTSIGGSMSDDWNNLIANQTARTLWHFESTNPETKKQERFASISALVGIAPRDECEGMIAAQLVRAITPQWSAIAER
jgi:hypothetical protein